VSYTPTFIKSKQAIYHRKITLPGEFLRSHNENEKLSADDILFGNIFDRPLKLPWGSGAAFKFMSYIDPTLNHDLGSQTKPWALSPLISTMPHFAHIRLSPPHSNDKKNVDSEVLSDDPTEAPLFPPIHSLIDDTSKLYKAVVKLDSSAVTPQAASTKETEPQSSATDAHDSEIKPNEILPEFLDSTQRRAFFSDALHRQKVVFGPQDVITTDFCYGFLEFSPSLSLVIPGGITFDLMKYWDGQPVRFVCCERKRGGEDNKNEEPWGPVFWCVSIELADDEEVVPENSGATNATGEDDVD
jgi:hypothetical protein